MPMMASLKPRALRLLVQLKQARELYCLMILIAMALLMQAKSLLQSLPMPLDTLLLVQPFQLVRVTITLKLLRSMQRAMSARPVKQSI